MKLAGSQIAQLLDALLDAYPSRDDLRIMMRVELDENFDAIAGGDTLRVAAFSLIEWAQRTGRTEELIAGARRSNPGNPALQAVSAALVLLPDELPPAGSSPKVAAFLRSKKEDRLRVLMAQYAAASRQLSLELNAAHRPLVQEQLCQLEAEMAGLQAEIEQLEIVSSGRVR
jgi:hypothetical protein